MAVNNSGQFTADIQNFIADETLPVAKRQLVIHQLGVQKTLPKGMGITWTATRYNRVSLPFAPLSEGVPPVGETMTISQITATAIQWGDGIKITDVAELTTKHPVMQEANQLIGIQIGELYERNDFNGLMACTNVNYVNSRGSRANLVAGDTLDMHTINRTSAALTTNGAYKFGDPEEADEKLGADSRYKRAYKNPAQSAHYLAVAHPLVIADIREQPLYVTASSYSNINALYNYEVGQWHGVRLCESNLVPFWTGYAQVNATPVPTGGTFAAGTYYCIITGQDTQNQYESYIAQVSNSFVLVNNGSFTITTPNVTGYTFNVYVGTTASPTNLGLSAQGPMSGALQGQATQLAPNTVVTVTGTGILQVPPAAPTTGITVYPTFVLGKGYFAVVKLDDVTITWLDKPDKLDWLNQLRIIGHKEYWGMVIMNPFNGARIESASAFVSTYG